MQTGEREAKMLDPEDENTESSDQAALTMTPSKVPQFLSCGNSFIITEHCIHMGCHFTKACKAPKLVYLVLKKELLNFGKTAP